MLAKTIIVFTSIYFESCCKISAWSNKSILQSFYHKIHLHVKACVHYFLSNFYFSSNDSPSKTMKNVFYFSFKFLYFCLPLFFSLSAIASGVDPRKILKIYDAINCLNKNLIIHFVWYIEKEVSCDIGTLSIDSQLNKEHFYEKIMQKMYTKS